MVTPVPGRPIGQRRGASPGSKATRADGVSAAEATGDGHLERTEQWHGLRPGDPVEIAGVAGRGLSWAFRAHVHNRRNGTEAVEVVGGRPGQRQVRSFRPDQVYPVGGRRHGRPSLADAPLLPFG
jgi:hypothetical protein